MDKSKLLRGLRRAEELMRLQDEIIGLQNKVLKKRLKIIVMQRKLLKKHGISKSGIATENNVVPFLARPKTSRT